MENPSAPNKQKVLLGLLEKEDENFIYIRTARRSYTFNKKSIISIEDTESEFREVER